MRFRRKKRDAETRYYERTQRQREALEEFAAHETEWAADLLLWYQVRKREIPDDEYRGAAFFLNKEYQRKPGSLTLCYVMYQKMCKELPPPTPELAFDLVAYRYYMYATVLAKGGYDGPGFPERG